MLQFFRKVWQRLWGRLRYCGAVSYTHLTLPTNSRV